MEKTYLRSIRLPDGGAEFGFLSNLRRYHTNSYPFHIFPEKGLGRLEFSPVTVLYGSNGSGKSTLLNVIAEKAGIIRHSPFSTGSLFGDYLDLCRLEGEAPGGSQILTSDDVFEYLIHLRNLNEGTQDRESELYDTYMDERYGKIKWTNLADYDNWKESHDARTRSQSEFIRDRVMQPIQNHSNGESAMAFFVQHIRENALYLLDEPENSLSIDSQKELAEFIVSSARFYGCQFVIASHSPVILSVGGDGVYDLDSFPVCTRKWTELENVRSYRDFFAEHEAEFAVEPAEGPCPELYSVLRKNGIRPADAASLCGVVPDAETEGKLAAFAAEAGAGITIQEMYHAMARFVKERG